MPKCERVRAKRRKMCVSDLEYEIAVIDPSIVAPSTGDAFEDYTRDVDVSTTTPIWASVQTNSATGARGKTIFDDTGTEFLLTHIFGMYYSDVIEYIDGGGSNLMVLFDERWFRVISYEDLDEAHDWVMLYCTERGKGNNLSNEV